MNLRLLILIFIVFFYSCQEDDNLTTEPEVEYSPEIRFDITTHFFPGENIKQIELTDNGFYYSAGSKIYLSDEAGSKLKTYSADSDVISLEFNSKDESLYFGTNSSGLGRVKGNYIQYFTVENSDLPRNLIRNVNVDNDGNIWFNASAHQVGGLVKYNGKHFTEYNPENSDLPENLIHKICIRENEIFVLSRGAETGKVGLKFKNNTWYGLFESGGCGITDMDIDSDGNIYYIEDSREYCGGGLLPDDVVFVFKDDEKTMLREYQNLMHIHYYLLKTDKRNYLWNAKFGVQDLKRLSVFDGENWYQPPDNFPDDFINCIEVDSDNNIWLGTNNGIYVINQ